MDASIGHSSKTRKCTSQGETNSRPTARRRSSFRRSLARTWLRVSDAGAALTVAITPSLVGRSKGGPGTASPEETPLCTSDSVRRSRSASSNGGLGAPPPANGELGAEPPQESDSLLPHLSQARSALDSGERDALDERALGEE